MTLAFDGHWSKITEVPGIRRRRRLRFIRVRNFQRVECWVSGEEFSQYAKEQIEILQAINEMW